MKRSAFLASAGVGSLFAAAAPVLAAPPLHRRNGRKALILVGGANRGAYEAGVIQAFVESDGLHDGQPLDYDLVAGASIGGLNAYLVATAQYTMMRDIWLGIISSRNVFRLKHPFNLIRDPKAGVASRVDAAVKLGTGLTKNLTGMLDPAPVRALLNEYVDLRAPIHIPTYIMTTNLAREEGQIFVRAATTPAGVAKQQLNDELLSAYPGIARPAGDTIFHDVMFATAAIPILFDPIVIPREDGSGETDQYVDGGVTSNVPIRVAQLCVDQLYAILLWPPRGDVNADYSDALAVGLGVFATMQYRILEYQVRLAYAAAERTLPLTPYIIQPSSALPGKGSDFNDQAALTEMWQRGYEAGKRGWQPFTPPSGMMLVPV